LRERSKNIKFGGSVRGSKKPENSGQKPTPHLRRNGDPPIYIVFKMPLPPHSDFIAPSRTKKSKKLFFSVPPAPTQRKVKKYFFFIFFFIKKSLKISFFFDKIYRKIAIIFTHQNAVFSTNFLTNFRATKR
jgi:hypothetical protein